MSVIACKRCIPVFLCSAAGWLQQTRCKGDASKLFPKYLSLFSDLCCGKGSFSRTSLSP